MEGSPECTCCLLEFEKHVYYRYTFLNKIPNETSGWIKSSFCWDTISTILKQRYNDYIETIYKSKCKKTLGEMIVNGPPIWFKDAALPVPDGANITHFLVVTFSNENVHEVEISAMYEGAVTGEERQKIWDSLKVVVDQRISIMNPNDENF